MHWETLVNSLDELDYYIPKLADVRLIVAIIVRAGQERDEEFLNSPAFRFYCSLIKCNSKDVLSSVKSLWV